MRSRYIYMKFLGLLLVLVGFSYSITSFNNFFSYIFKTRIFDENLNILFMSLGLFVPLFTFIFGIYFYFYTDFNITKINKFLFISYIGLLIIGFSMLYVNSFNSHTNFLILQIFEFVHISFAPVIILLASLGLYGCHRYKY